MDDAKRVELGLPIKGDGGTTSTDPQYRQSSKPTQADDGGVREREWPEPTTWIPGEWNDNHVKALGVASVVRDALRNSDASIEVFRALDSLMGRAIDAGNLAPKAAPPEPVAIRQWRNPFEDQRWTDTKADDRDWTSMQGAVGFETRTVYTRPPSLEPQGEILGYVDAMPDADYTISEGILCEPGGKIIIHPAPKECAHWAIPVYLNTASVEPGAAREVLERLVSARLGSPTYLEALTYLRTALTSGPAALQPDIDFCSKCHEHTEFVMINDELLSVCCGTLPISSD